MMEGYESPGDPPENKLEARDGADSPKPTEAGPATPDLPGDAVAELRAQVAELSRIGSGLEDAWTLCLTWSPSSCRAARA